MEFNKSRLLQLALVGFAFVTELLPVQAAVLDQQDSPPPSNQIVQCSVVTYYYWAPYWAISADGTAPFHTVTTTTSNPPPSQFVGTNWVESDDFELIDKSC